MGGSLGAGQYALIDDADWPSVGRHSWHIWRNRAASYGRRPTIYPATWVTIDGKRLHLRMHTFLTGLSRVDHVDRDGMNNQRDNFRECTPGQNSANTSAHADSTSRYKGVSWHKLGRKWAAQIVGRGYLGLFSDEKDAARAYDEAAVQLWGEFANLNFPLSAPDILIE